MKFTCEKALLVSAISLASRTVSPKSTIACLEGILLRAGVGIQLTGFNLETGITVKVGATVLEAGSCVMPARLFYDIIRKLPDEEVTIEVDAKYAVSIRGGASSFKITAMDAEDYPDLPEVDADNGVPIPQSAMRELIGSTLFSVKVSQGPTLTYYNFHGRGTLNGAIAHPRMAELALKAADECGIRLQKFASTGMLTDSAYLQLENEGVALVDMGFPARYTHTPIEVCDLEDIEQLSAVVHRMLLGIDSGFSFNRYDI